VHDLLDAGVVFTPGTGIDMPDFELLARIQSLSLVRDAFMAVGQQVVTAWNAGVTHTPCR
jgi:hypothetical protein